MLSLVLRYPNSDVLHERRTPLRIASMMHTDANTPHTTSGLLTGDESSKFAVSDLYLGAPLTFLISPSFGLELNSDTDFNSDITISSDLEFDKIKRRSVDAARMLSASPPAGPRNKQALTPRRRGNGELRYADNKLVG
ncbi:hypothetical protein EVAR_102334_1 [Eumeta japonica]|uniref:Uncharacterized protein n=1 Tax=Eumeta variegata TaxID=151549 RepID=A0A4C1ZED5_EUMVA|nr:hypothetical protein EVAR_102334_1 [Eumeta japonica]